MPDGSPIEACGDHLAEAYAYCQELLRPSRGDPTWMDRVYLPRESVWRLTESGPVVYYVRIGAWIKIGTTQHFRRRMWHLNADRVLAVEQGSYEREAARHEQFWASHVTDVRGMELFHPTDDLRDHILGLVRDLEAIDHQLHSVTTTGALDTLKIERHNPASKTSVPTPLEFGVNRTNPGHGAS